MMTFCILAILARFESYNLRHIIVKFLPHLSLNDALSFALLTVENPVRSLTSNPSHHLQSGYTMKHLLTLFALYSAAYSALTDMLLTVDPTLAPSRKLPPPVLDIQPRHRLESPILKPTQ